MTEELERLRSRALEIDRACAEIAESRGHSPHAGSLRWVFELGVVSSLARLEGRWPSEEYLAIMEEGLRVARRPELSAVPPAPGPKRPRSEKAKASPLRLVWSADRP